MWSRRAPASALFLRRGLCAFTARKGNTGVCGWCGKGGGGRGGYACRLVLVSLLAPRLLLCSMKAFCTCTIRTEDKGSGWCGKVVHAQLQRIGHYPA
eukprot:6921744-Prorocentrum_lima.AAC.1